MSLQDLEETRGTCQAVGQKTEHQAGCPPYCGYFISALLPLWMVWVGSCAVWAEDKTIQVTAGRKTNSPHRLGQSVHGEKLSGDLVQSPMQLCTRTEKPFHCLPASSKIQDFTQSRELQAKWDLALTANIKLQKHSLKPPRPSSHRPWLTPSWKFIFLNATCAAAQATCNQPVPPHADRSLEADTQDKGSGGESFPP